MIKLCGSILQKGMKEMKKILGALMLGVLLASGVVSMSSPVNVHAADYSTQIPSWSGYKYLTSACDFDDINVSWNNSTKEATFERGWGSLTISLRNLQDRYGVKLENGKLKITYSNYVKLYDYLRLYM